MPFKPVGVDENGKFPLRVRQALADTFVSKPANIRDGQVPVWDAATQTWIPGTLGSGGSAPATIDGGTPTG